MVATKTYMAKAEGVRANWLLVDADNLIVGRLATKIATVLMGKHKAIYTPHVDCGDYVIVLNVEKIRFSGQTMSHATHPYFTEKWNKKIYQTYSGWPSGQKNRTAAEVYERKPEMILREAVRRMLPKNKLARQMLKKLKLYTGTEHPHQAQQPQDMPKYLLP